MYAFALQQSKIYTVYQIVKSSRQLIFLLPLLLILPHVMDNPIDGVWYASPVSDCISSILAMTLLGIEVKKFRKRIA